MWHSDSPDWTCSDIWRQIHILTLCMPNANVVNRVLFGVFHALTGIPSHHLKHPIVHTGEVRPFMFGSFFESMCFFWFCLTPTVRSQSLNIFFMWFLERFYHTSISLSMYDRFPCICRSIISAPTNFIQSRLHLWPFWTWLWKSSPIPTICSGIHCIEPSFYYANAFQTASKYDVAVHRTLTVFPWVRLRLVVLFSCSCQTCWVWRSSC
jgi:hypothetical protein